MKVFENDDNCNIFTTQNLFACYQNPCQIDSPRSNFQGLNQDYIEKKLQAAFQVITNSPDLSKECAQFAIPAICLSTFPLCDAQTKKPRKVSSTIQVFTYQSFFSRLLPKPQTYFYVHLINGEARIFPNSYAATGNQTQVISVAPLFAPGHFTD